jgi:membrane associated rhomboid family serine protease
MFPIKDSIHIPRAPFIVYTIILINVVVFLYQSTLSPAQSFYFSLEHALVPRRYFDPYWGLANGLSPKDYWPFITGTFMHGGWLHILLNMWTFFIFGRSLEGRLGPFPFLAFYLLCALAASLAHAYFNRDSTVPALGASGAIAGVMGGYAMTFPKARVTLLIPIVIIPFIFKMPALAFGLLWFVLQFMQGFVELVSPTIGGGIAWWAHIGGFVAGVILIPLFRFGRDETWDEDASPRQFTIERTRWRQLPAPTPTRRPNTPWGGPWG